MSKNFLMQASFLIFSLIIIGLIIWDIKDDKDNKKQSLLNYEIVEESDVSYLAQKRFTYRVVVDSNIQDEDIKTLFKKIINYLNHDRSTEVTIWLYSNKEIANGTSPYDIAMAEHLNGRFTSLTINNYRKRIGNFQLSEPCNLALKSWEVCYKKRICSYLEKNFHIKYDTIKALKGRDFENDIYSSCEKLAKLVSICLSKSRDGEKIVKVVAGNQDKFISKLSCF